MDLQEREFVAEIMRQAMEFKIKPSHKPDVLNRAFAARDAGMLAPTFMQELTRAAPDFFGEAAQPPGPTPPLKKPASTLPVEAYRDPGVIRLTREQGLDVLTYRRARAEAERTGKVLEIAE